MTNDFTVVAEVDAPVFVGGRSVLEKLAGGLETLANV
jgi:hypothetical protein